MSREGFLARKICFEMLFDVFERGGYAQLVLKQRFKSETGLSSRDKSFITAVFYEVIARTFTLDHIIGLKIKGNIRSLDPLVRTVLRMGVWQILFSGSVPDHAAVNTSVEIISKRVGHGAKALVNAVLRAVAGEADFLKAGIRTAKPDVRFSMSSEIAGLLIKWYGKDKAESIAAAFFEEAKVTARVNTLRCSRDRLQELLEEEEVESDIGLYSDQALTLRLQGTPLDALKAYRDGLFMIQDEAAMLAGIITDPKPEDRILDLCAAPGGKSCHLAELSNDDAEILATDINESRLELVKQNAKRLGIRSIRTGIADAREPDSSVFGPEESFDIVLADVPCSGLGLLKRKPDIRLTISYERIRALYPIQDEILRNAARYVKKGGCLMYCTCTINPDENENRVAAFLAERSDFRIEPITEIIASKPAFSERHRNEAKEGRLLLLPDEDGCDGFFISKMRRIV